MKLVAEAGVWVTGPSVSGPPAAAVLEVSGAVFEWTVDDPDGTAATRLTITDVPAADWLWRVVGTAGHAVIVAALDGDRGDQEVELAPEALEPLRRLAVGYWLRRWWPESSRDGIVRLDRALLDGELAVLTNAAQEFFTEDTVDSDVAGLLAPHRAALLALERDGDPRVAELVRACVDLADEVGAWSVEFSVVASEAPRGRRGDYALAAGPDGDRRSGAISRGEGSIDWVSLPANVFDAAEDTIDWSIEAAGDSVVASVRVATMDGGGGRGTAARGIVVRLSSGAVRATGVLDVDGTAALPLFTNGDRALTENQAWDHDWSTTVVTIGPERPVVADAAILRQRVRDVARARLSAPGPDAFLAEIVAAESDY
jgi:hypothetical protein